MKQNFLNKFFSKLLPSLSETANEQISDEDKELENLRVKSDDPVDVIFAKNFTKNNGKFFYCDNIDSFFSNFENLLSESRWNMTYCINSKLKKMLKATSIEIKNNHLDADSSISNCEFLIAFDGSVMVSSEQTKNIKIEELPDSLVIVAYTSQIVKNISEGLNGIQIKYGQSRPSLVTTIRTKESISTMSDSDRTKDLYVFLIEDFKEKR